MVYVLNRFLKAFMGSKIESCEYFFVLVLILVMRSGPMCVHVTKIAPLLLMQEQYYFLYLIYGIINSLRNGTLVQVLIQVPYGARLCYVLRRTKCIPSIDAKYLCPECWTYRCSNAIQRKLTLTFLQVNTVRIQYTKTLRQQLLYGEICLLNACWWLVLLRNLQSCFESTCWLACRTTTRQSEDKWENLCSLFATV